MLDKAMTSLAAVKVGGVYARYCNPNVPENTCEDAQRQHGGS